MAQNKQEIKILWSCALQHARFYDIKAFWKTPNARLRTHRAHQGVEHADSEGGAAGKRLSEVQLRVWVVIVVLVQELNVWVIDWETRERRLARGNVKRKSKRKQAHAPTHPRVLKNRCGNTQ